MDTLERVNDLSAADWLRKNVDSTDNFESRDGNYVTHCIPDVFESYCKVFHNVYEDVSIDDRSITWDEVSKRESANLDDPVEKLIHDSTMVYGGDFDPNNLKRIRWSDLAARYSLQFHPELNVDSFSRNFPTRSWPRYLIGPDEGMLDDSTCKEIVRSIALATSDFDLSQQCFFLYDLIATTNYESDLLYKGRLKSLFDTPKLEDVSGTPTYWWPADNKWLVCTDWDLTFTLIGGSEEFISSIISNSEIECLLIEPTNRIDYKSDTVNP